MSDLSANVVGRVEDRYTRNGKPLKSQLQRLNEGITILKKLKELGIPPSEPGYYMTKQKIDEWIAGGDEWEGRIDFPRFQRRGELVLPVKPDRVANMTIFAPRK